MERTRAERRKKNYAEVRRKKKIANRLYGCDRYEHDGQYIKGKVHCSCGLCCAKTNNKKWGYKSWKHSDTQKINSMDYQMVEFFEEKAS